MNRCDDCGMDRDGTILIVKAHRAYHYEWQLAVRHPATTTRGWDMQRGNAWRDYALELDQCRHKLRDRNGDLEDRVDELERLASAMDR